MLSQAGQSVRCKSNSPIPVCYKRSQGPKPTPFSLRLMCPHTQTDMIPPLMSTRQRFFFPLHNNRTSRKGKKWGKWLKWDYLHRKNAVEFIRLRRRQLHGRKRQVCQQNVNNNSRKPSTNAFGHCRFLEVFCSQLISHQSITFQWDILQFFSHSGKRTHREPCSEIQGTLTWHKFTGCFNLPTCSALHPKQNQTCTPLCIRKHATDNQGHPHHRCSSVYPSTQVKAWTLKKWKPLMA